MSNTPLEGRTALVTGASRNIGRQIALDLASAGAAVVVNGVTDQQAADTVAAEIKDHGGRAIAHLAEVTDRTAVDVMVARATEELGPVTVLVCNASARGQVPFLEMTHAQFRRVVDISLDGAFHLSQACLPAMVDAGLGRRIRRSGDYGKLRRAGSHRYGAPGLSRHLAGDTCCHPDGP
ncbi:MAG: SDR family NAD(P)-dependent oxidoreductase [Pseudomonadota bacterium]